MNLLALLQDGGLLPRATDGERERFGIDDEGRLVRRCGDDDRGGMNQSTSGGDLATDEEGAEAGE